MTPKIQIKLAGSGDREIIVGLFLKLLEFIDQFEHDMLPTRKNAEYMADHVFMPAAERGEPILIAWEGEKPVGAVFWTLQHPPYDCRLKTAIGYGTYLEEEYRSKKIGSKIRRRAFEILHEKGAEILLASVLYKNTLSVKNCEQTGGIPVAIIEHFDVRKRASS